MVWLNTIHSNRKVRKGVMGGSMCICPECREERLKQNRLNQPLDELERKADKATRYKQKIWTLEEIEWAEASASDLMRAFGWK